MPCRCCAGKRKRQTLPPDRADLEQRWLDLTRRELPALAAERRWPIRNDHCFQRVLLDNACGGCWYHHVGARPAYRHASPEVLAAALVLGEEVRDGRTDLAELNRRSLIWRGKHPR
jgi:hypothetical protein